MIAQRYAASFRHWLWVMLLVFSGADLGARSKPSRAYSLLPLHTDSLVHRERLSAADLEFLAAAEDSILEALQFLQNPDTNAYAGADSNLDYAHKLKMAKQLLWQFRLAMRRPNSFAYSFRRLQNNLSLVYPRDSSFRIFTWQYSLENLRAIKQGLIQMNTVDGSAKIYPLYDKSAEIHALLDTITTNEAWIGAMYYYIHSCDLGRKRIYTLLGIDEHHILSTRKWIEILRFAKNGTPYFGGPFFSWVDLPKKNTPAKRQTKTKQIRTDQARTEQINSGQINSGSSRLPRSKSRKGPPDLQPIKPVSVPAVSSKLPIVHKRFMLEYTKNTVVNLRYDPQLGMLIFDHLQPSDDATIDRHYTYDIDGDYEGFIWQKDRWVHIQNVFDFQLEGGKVPRDKPVNFRKQLQEYEKIMRR